MKYISNTEPFREVDNRNNFMLIKQELKRYEKELELKAGKGFLTNNFIEFSNTLNPNYSNNSMNNMLSSKFNLQRDHFYLSEKRKFDEDYGNLSIHKSKKLTKIDDYTSTPKNSNFQNEFELDDFKINKM